MQKENGKICSIHPYCEVQSVQTCVVKVLLRTVVVFFSTEILVPRFASVTLFCFVVCTPLPNTSGGPPKCTSRGTPTGTSVGNATRTYGQDDLLEELLEELQEQIPEELLEKLPDDFLMELQEEILDDVKKEILKELTKNSYRIFQEKS